MTHNAQVDGPMPIDLHVGRAIRARRKLLGISQQALAEAIGLTFQQVQKYERGTNRVSASKLWDIAHTLKAGVVDFFPASAEQLGTDAIADLEVVANLPFVLAVSRLGPSKRRAVEKLVAAMSEAGDVAEPASEAA